MKFPDKDVTWKSFSLCMYKDLEVFLVKNSIPVSSNNSNNSNLRKEEYWTWTEADTSYKDSSLGAAFSFGVW